MKKKILYENYYTRSLKMTEAQKNVKNEDYIDSLKDEINYLREILASKLFEEDNLINFTCREIETDYSLKFGVYK